MCGGGIFQKPNVGFGAGVRPTENMAGMNYGLPTASEIFRQKEAMMPQSMGQPNVITQIGIELNKGNMNKIYSAADVSEAQGLYDRAEARRQEKLDALAELAQGEGGSGGGVKGQIVGDGGDLNIQHTAMNRGKDGFPTLADFEQPLHPFMGKRKLRGLA